MFAGELIVFRLTYFLGSLGAFVHQVLNVYFQIHKIILKCANMQPGIGKGYFEWYARTFSAFP